MDRKTVLAMVISAAIVFGYYYFLQGRSQRAEIKLDQETAAEQTAPSVGKVVPASEGGTEERLAIDTNLVTAEFTTAGGDLVSYKLKDHIEDGRPVEMILAGEQEPHAFSVAFDKDPVENIFQYNRISARSIEFFQDFDYVPPDGSENSRFRLSKRYDFLPDEYMFELTVTIDGGAAPPPLDFEGGAYLLSFGPQIGPAFKKLDNRYEYRRYINFFNGKQKNVKIEKSGIGYINADSPWAAIAGKYFAFIALPSTRQQELAFSTAAEPGLTNASRLLLSPPPPDNIITKNVYRFYLGPKNQKTLEIYDTAKSAYKFNDLRISGIASTSGILSPIEWVLKWLLVFFYHLVPNYGVAIIFLTIVMRLVLFPLTKKSTESTARMQELSPKIKEIQDKYKDNPQKMNAEMSDLYKKEGYNPLSGCLPMLIQLPLILAMNNIFNTHFDLRQASFIPGWISDLSRPETFIALPFRVPIVGWTDLRLLPFIYLVSQLVYALVLQTPDQKSNSQMKIMLYVMPVVMFFVLYDLSSGLLLYWIMVNLLMMAQQVFLNKYMAAKKAKTVVSAPAFVPQKKKKKK
jgi:YidC/Oxa1 family membrane protein insertase